MTTSHQTPNSTLSKLDSFDTSIDKREVDNETIIQQGKEKLRLPQKVVDSLKKKHYGVYGHSGVQVCGWTKKSLKDEGVCYKQKFYGIECHSCMEFSPAVMWCQENCTFCWRPMEFMKNIEIDAQKVDDVEDIIENLMIERKKLLSGFKGNEKLNTQKFEETNTPTHFAISLSGEPTMYPKLDKMIEYLKNLNTTKSVFVVTNAQIPEFFEKLKQNPKSLPTQLYISLESPTKELFQKINKSLYADGWQRFHKSLKIFSTLDTRKVLRFTQIKGINDTPDLFDKYKTQIELSKADFIEIKAYMHIGMSQNRHTRDQMPEFNEVVDFGKQLCEHLENYEYVDCAPNSRIILLRRKNSKYNLELVYENKKN